MLNQCAFRMAIGALPVFGLFTAVHADESLITSADPIVCLMPKFEEFVAEGATVTYQLMEATRESLPPILLLPPPTHLPEWDSSCDGSFVIPGIITAPDLGFDPCANLDIGAITIDVTITAVEPGLCLLESFAFADAARRMERGAQGYANWRYERECPPPLECYVTNTIEPGIYHSHVQASVELGTCTMIISICARIEVLGGTVGLCLASGPPQSPPWLITPPCGCPRPAFPLEAVP